MQHCLVLQALIPETFSCNTNRHVILKYELITRHANLNWLILNSEVQNVIFCHSGYVLRLIFLGWHEYNLILVLGNDILVFRRVLECNFHIYSAPILCNGQVKSNWDLHFTRQHNTPTRYTVPPTHSSTHPLSFFSNVFLCVNNTKMLLVYKEWHSFFFYNRAHDCFLCTLK